MNKEQEKNSENLKNNLFKDMWPGTEVNVDAGHRRNAV